MWNYPEIRFLADSITYHARREPSRTALVFEGQTYSYEAVETESSQVANALISAGVAAGDRVVYFGKNAADFFLALFGTAKSGACFTPLNWRLVAVELGVIVADAVPCLAFVEREFLPVWQEICTLAKLDVQAVVFDHATPLSSWYAAYGTHPPAVRLREDDAVIQLYTSGTTGVPKGVLHTHASFNHSRLSEHFERAYDWRDGDVFLLSLIHI